MAKRNNTLLEKAESQQGLVRDSSMQSLGSIASKKSENVRISANLDRFRYNSVAEARQMSKPTRLIQYSSLSTVKKRPDYQQLHYNNSE